MINAGTMNNEMALNMIFNQLMLGMRTNIPAIVDSSEPYKVGKFWCVDAIPAINMVDTTKDQRTPTTKQMRKLDGIPIVCLSGGGFAVTSPVKKGDSVWLSVSDRGIDNWQLEANTQDPPEIKSLRHHDLTDAVAIIGALSVNQLESYYNDGVSVQVADGSTFAHINKDNIELVEAGGASIVMKGGIVTINADIVHNGNTTHTGNTNQSGSTSISGEVSAPNINATASLKAAGSEVVGHKHKAGTPPGDTGPLS